MYLVSRARSLPTGYSKTIQDHAALPIARSQRVQRRLPPDGNSRLQARTMHSFWQRLNSVFFYALSVLGFLAFAAAGTTYWHQADPRISLSLKKIMLCVTGP